MSPPDSPLAVHCLTLAIIVNIVAVGKKEYAVLPLALICRAGRDTEERVLSGKRFQLC
jgi:hypothetical protein